MVWSNRSQGEKRLEAESKPSSTLVQLDWGVLTQTWDWLLPTDALGRGEFEADFARW